MTIDYYIHKFSLENILPNHLRGKLYLKNYIKGELILDAHEEVKNIYFVLKGRVEVTFVMADGRELFVNFISPLEIFGDIEYINRNKALFDVSAIDDSTILIVPFDIVDKYLGENPHFLRFICEEGYKKLIRTNKTIFLRNSLSLESYFCNYLAQHGYTINFDTLGNLATELNVSYRNLTRVIKNLAEQHIIKKERHRISVLNKKYVDSYKEEL